VTRALLEPDAFLTWARPLLEHMACGVVLLGPAGVIVKADPLAQRCSGSAGGGLLFVCGGPRGSGQLGGNTLSSARKKAHVRSS
jgi:hypothetical protein